MIRQLRLVDHRGRDATVLLLPVRMTETRQNQTLDGHPVRHLRRIKATADTHPDALYARYPDPDDLARALIDGDPEIDRQAVGRATGPCDRVFLDGDGNVCYAPVVTEVRYHADGTERDHRPVGQRTANLVPATSPVWSGVLIPRREIVRRLAFSRVYQVAHQDTLQFDFLYDIAQYLHTRDAMVQVGSGRQGRGPLYCERNGPAYRGFLDGRINGEAMRVVLYLATGELMLPEARP